LGPEKLPLLILEILERGAPLFWKTAQRPPKVRIISKQDPKLDGWISEGLEKGVIARISRKEAHCILPIFTIPKPNGSVRLIFDLRIINAYTKPPKFKLEGLKLLGGLIRPFDQLVKIDIKDAFYHIAHKPRDLPFICFEYKGEVYSHIAMSMGSAGSPFIFSKIMKPLIRKWRSRGIRIIVYLDDMILMAPSDLIISQRDTVLEDLKILGWTLNEEKSNLKPTYTQEFLGIVINTDRPDPIISLSKKKRNTVAHELERFCRNPGGIPVKLAMRIAGLGVSLSPVMVEAETLIRSLLRRIGTIQNPNEWSRKKIEISPEIRADLGLLAQRLRRNPTRLIHPEATIEIRSDASPKGLGAVVILNGTVLYTTQQSLRETPKHHINLLELQAVLMAIQKFGKIIKDLGHKVLKIRVDNTTSAAYTRRGTGRKPKLAKTARTIVMLAQKLGLTLLPEYLPGKNNTLADILSRFLNHKAEGVEEPYLFPTARPSVIFKALEIATSHNMKLITPYWKSAPWFPVLLTKSIGAKRLFLPNHHLDRQHRTGFIIWLCSSRNNQISQSHLDTFATQIEKSIDWVWRLKLSPEDMEQTQRN
jgi:hypothetical protein